MNDFNANFYTVIISVLAAVVSIISLVISWISYRSDRYKLKSKYSFWFWTGWLEWVNILNVEIANTGKRPTTVHAVRFYVLWWNQLFFFNDRVYIQKPTFPYRLDENESVSVIYDMNYLVAGILEQNQKLEYIGIDTQDWKIHKIPVWSKKFKRMISFVSK